MVDEALHPVQDEEVRSCLQDFTKSVGGIRLSDCGKVVVGDFPSPSTDGNDRIHCGCAICGIRCVGREPSNDEEQEGELLGGALPRWHLVSLGDLVAYNNGVYTIDNDAINRYRRENVLHRLSVIGIQGRIGQPTAYLKIQRRYLEREHFPVSNVEPNVLEQLFPENARAFVCGECYRPSAQGSTTIRGVTQRQEIVLRLEPGLLGSDGLPVGLPHLSHLQQLLIKRVRLFSNVLKIAVDSGAAASVKGHVICTPTNAAERASMAQQLLFPHVPPPDGSPILSVCFIGPMERLQTILHANVGEAIARPVRLLRERYLTSDYEPIRMWLSYLRRYNRGYQNIVIAEDTQTVAAVNGLGNAIWQARETIDDRAAQRIEDVLHREAQPNADSFNTEDCQHPATPAYGESANAGTDAALPVGYSLVEVHDGTDGVNIEQRDSEFFQQVLLDVQGYLRGSRNGDRTPTSSSNEEATTDDDAEENADAPEVRMRHRPVEQDAPSQRNGGEAVRRTAVQVDHSRILVNEYETTDFLMSCGFPTLFPHGYIDEQKPMTNTMLQLLLRQADNRFSDNSEFIFYMFNQRRRQATAQGVSFLWRRDPSCFERLRQALADPNIERDLLEAARNPSGLTGKRVMRLFLPLVSQAGKNVPYGNAGSSERAMADMLALQRYFGPSSWFLTYNPVMRDIPLALDLAEVVGNNWTPEAREYLRWPNAARAEHLESHPVGAVLGFIIVRHSLYKNLLQIPLGMAGSSSKTSLSPPLRSPGQVARNPGPYRRRGLLGAAHAVFEAIESSQAANQHGHARVHGSLVNWRFLRHICHNPDRNRQVGQYLSSIQKSSLVDLSAESGWGMKTLPWHPPLLPFAPKDESAEQTALNTLLNSAQTIANHGERVLAYTFTHKQNHFPHNASCFKYHRTESTTQTRCRFRYPAYISNNENGIYQGKLVEVQNPNDPDHPRKVVRLLNGIEADPIESIPPPPFTNLGFKDDKRCLLYVPYRPSLNEAAYATMSDAAGTSPYVEPVRSVDQSFSNGPIYRPEDLAKQGSENNQWFVDNVVGITAANIGQNNIQFETANGMGTKSYTCKYVAKGDGSKLKETVSLLYKAYAEARRYPSVHSDATTNPHRASMRLLNRVVNGGFKMKETERKQALSSLFQLQQFQSSHRFQFVHGAAALKALLRDVGPSDNVFGNEHTDSDADDGADEVFFFEGQEENEMGTLAQGVPEGDEPEAAAPIVIVSQAYHYLHRPIELAHFSLTEFACLTRLVGIENNMNADLFRRTHPQANRRYDLPPTHVQSRTKQVQLCTDAGIPLYTGLYIPQCPTWALSPDVRRDQPAEFHRWQNLWDHFGALMVTLFCPWSLDTGKPTYTLDREGFEAFYAQGAQGTDADLGEDISAPRRIRRLAMQAREPHLRNFEREIRAGRKLSIDNIVAAQYSSSEVSKVETHWRRQRSHTASEAERLPRRRQSLDEESHRPHGVALEPHLEEDAVIHELIDELRELFDLVEHSTLSTRGQQNVKDKAVVSDVFTILGLYRHADLADILDGNDGNVGDNEEVVEAEGEIQTDIEVGFPAEDAIDVRPVPAPTMERLCEHVQADHVCGVVVNFGSREVNQVAVPDDDDEPPGVQYGRDNSRQFLASQVTSDVEALRRYDPAVPSDFSDNVNGVLRPTRDRRLTSSEWDRIALTLNADQRRAADGLVDVAFGRNEGTQILQLWHGAAGCGKTYVINAVRALFGERETMVTSFAGRAASFHNRGLTLHALFGLPIGFSHCTTVLSARRRAELRAKLDGARILFIDEISMLPSKLLLAVNHILQDLYGLEFERRGLVVPPFAGMHIILAGHFLQLPAVGARNLMDAAIATPEQDVDDHLGAGQLFRQFQRFSLSIPQRSSNDIVLRQFLNRCEDPVRHRRPFSLGVLEPTCVNCELRPHGGRIISPYQRQFQRRATPRDHPPPRSTENDFTVCPHDCPHRCQHLKVLNKHDVEEDPAWQTCYFTSPMNSSCDNWTRARLEDYAKRGNHIVLRWRLPPLSTSSAVAELTDAEVDQIHGLWGYYVHQGPVSLTYNVNVPAGIGHHSEGRLVGIALEDDTLRHLNGILGTGQQRRSGPHGIITLLRPPIAVFIRMTSLSNQRHVADIPTSGFIPRREADEPPVITLLQGSTLSHKNSTQRRESVSLGDLPIAATVDPALWGGSIAQQRGRTQQLRVEVVNAGYRMNFASTVHGLQGATIRGKLLVDLNKNPVQRNSITVSGAYVTLSRVQTFDDIRVAPWQNGFAHLQSLEHDETYIDWEQCYNPDGRFDIANLRARDSRTGTNQGTSRNRVPPNVVQRSRTSHPSTERQGGRTSFPGRSTSNRAPEVTSSESRRAATVPQLDLTTPRNNSVSNLLGSTSRAGSSSGSHQVNDQLRQVADFTYSRVYVPLLQQVFYPYRQPTRQEREMMAHINTILVSDANCQSLNEATNLRIDLNWNNLVALVRTRLRNLIGQDMFVMIFTTLVRQNQYIEDVPQEILLGNTTRANSLSAGHPFREIARAIDEGVSRLNANPVSTASSLLDLASQTLAFSRPELFQ